MAYIFVIVLEFGTTGVFMAVIMDETIRAIINTLKHHRISNAIETNYQGLLAEK
ncbi:MAG: hypothetical protein HUJ71_08130 [Pseudobutyrivibrio sp.]|nr:hypothetical protein [Pseudobutyrivibrio sp.]